MTTQPIPLRSSPYSLADHALALRLVMARPDVATDPERYHAARGDYERALSAWLAWVGGERGVAAILATWQRMDEGRVA